MFDTHCHLDFEAYDEDRAQVLARASAAGVRAVFVPGVAPDQWGRAAALCRRHAGVTLCCGVGVHPWWLARLPEGEIEAALAGLERSATTLGVAAIGECGLDRLLVDRAGVSLSRQQAVLGAQLEVAGRLGLPVVLHVVRAHGALLSLLERRGPLPAGGVLHSFAGAPELVARYAAFGLMFSFSGGLTRANARRARSAVRAVPRARLLFESDGPDQVPVGVPARRSEPAHLTAVVAAAARLRGEPAAALAGASRANAERLFGVGVGAD